MWLLVFTFTNCTEGNVIHKTANIEGYLFMYFTRHTSN